MAVANTNALELLGKEVSFISECKVDLTEKSFVTYSKKHSGVVTNITISLDSEPEFSIDDGDFFEFSGIKDFVVKN